MNCTVDGMVRNIQGVSAGGVIGILNREFAESGKVMSSLLVNGEEFFGEEEELGYGVEVSSLEITTDTPVNLALKALVSGQEYMDDLRDFLLKTVDLFRGGDEVRGKEYFLESVQGLQWLVKMVSHIGQILCLDFDRITHDGCTLGRIVEHLKQICSDILDAQEKGDHVLLADLIEYELVPQMESWKEIFAMLKGRVS